MKVRNLNVNFRKMVSLRGVSLLLTTALIATSLTGCKKVDCGIKDNHAHLYVNDSGYSRYVQSEHVSYEGYSRRDEYIELDKDEVDLYKFIDKKDLLSIQDNLDVILEQQEVNKDYIEYRYRYTYLQPIPHYVSTGKTRTVFFSYIPITHYSWTSDPEHSRLTGEERLCHYVYTAYKIVKDENGKYVLVPSDQVDDLREVMDEYPYVKKNYYKVIDYTYGTDLDYEDGPSTLSTEEQEELETNYSDKIDVEVEDTKKLTK